MIRHIGPTLYEDVRWVIHGEHVNYNLVCTTCGTPTRRWTAAEIPSAAEDMWHSTDGFKSGNSGYFYSFWNREFRVSFPDCGHQELKYDSEVLEHYYIIG